MCRRANALWHLGFPDRANAIEREALAWAKKLNHHNTTGYALFFAGALPAFRRRDIVVLDRYAEELVAYGEQHDLPQWGAYGKYLQGPALAATAKQSRTSKRLLRLRSAWRIGHFARWSMAFLPKRISPLEMRIVQFS